MHSHAPRILVADDNELFAHMVQFMLQRKGLNVDTAEDGIDAIEKYHERPYDLVIVDLVMPRMDGIQLICALREMEETAAVIAMSGTTFYNAKSCLAAAKQLGADDTLVKPFKQEELYAKVFALLKPQSHPALPETEEACA